MDDPEVKAVPQINLDKRTWEGWLNNIVLWAAQDPGDFLMTVILMLSPFFVISLLLAWRLAKLLDLQKKELARKAKRDSMTAKIRKIK